jgi:ubiquinone/menaquinone biosynthesis C-methylase UbiE
MARHNRFRCLAVRGSSIVENAKAGQEREKIEMATNHQTEQMPTAMLANVLRQQIMGFRVTQLIYVAARLGIADQLAQGPQPVAELAKHSDAEPGALYRLLRALASLGLFAETTDGTFALTPATHLLQRNVPGSLYGLALLYGDEWLWQAYGKMLYSVQTGASAFEQVHGQPLYGYLEQHPEAASAFYGAMSAYSGQEVVALLAAYDFGPVTKLIDVGGGHGALLAALLRAYPTLMGVLFDLPPVIAEAQQSLGETGIADRIEWVAGDFFQGLPAGGDLYLLKSVLHNWNDEQCITILKHCRQAMNQTGRLLVVERVLPPGNEPAEAKLFDINMLVVVGGQERTAADFQALLHAAGFRLTRLIPTGSPLTLVEAVPEVDR